eukprot:scaffold253993_cov37-Tisochrysis_lutea.AAC.1
MHCNASCVFPAPAAPASSVSPCASRPPPSVPSSMAQPVERSLLWIGSLASASAERDGLWLSRPANDAIG